ncbi:MAG: hypothetical protein K2J78_04855, partial [Muribaculaceae bacterium]|nr:hypothetical protein [Muribaculaceae bacterium]
MVAVRAKEEVCMDKSPCNKYKCGIVFVHGIVGNLRIFDFLMPLLPATLTFGNSLSESSPFSNSASDSLTSDDYIVKSITLDGHGGNAND